MAGKIEIEPTIKVGDLLTSVSILVTFVGLLIAWSNQRASEDRAQADKARLAAAATLAKLERTQELSLWYYEEVKPLFVTASEELPKAPDSNAVRDKLWRELDNARATTVRRIHEERVEQSYVELYGYYPQAYEILKRAINDLKTLDESLAKDFQNKTETDIFSLVNEGRTGVVPGYTSAELGRRLRDTASSYRQTYKTESDKILSKPREFILSIIRAPDDKILQRVGDKDDSGEILQQ